ncbi:uncharacterized protein LOC128983552 isoform X2 [Macrosteles quadrilineatus]|uniref:uncharacterized protein LOC128983552 isoform X2 n=1 Tax=Macrosteles quadrilineatus TaxID=74068 RepID=UPI0023E15FB0|nr:uncharacterized protein LOC128983552 isoform X2 [Macrosteles quadrilineatus]
MPNRKIRKSRRYQADAETEEDENSARFAFGKNSFLTGFGLGFLAFGLKKLLLPVFIGAQIVKSVLLAMFLPSIIGGIAKLMGKGLTSVAQGSSSSAHGAGQDTISDFDFKDTGTGGGGGGYDSLGAGSDDNTGVWTYPPDSSGRQPFPAYTSSGLGATSAAAAALKQPQDRYQAVKSSYQHQGSFYSRDKLQDFKVFHGIPASSQLLANYDPFYSPLLSRLDAVFQQLGHTDEVCRERLVCHMYNNPAKFAPFSNLVSAQLSRELNELRKPSTDNPEILRFFRYMKAAKDGQDGAECDRTYPGCAVSLEAPARAPMLTTYNSIDKLVQARRLA